LSRFDSRFKSQPKIAGSFSLFCCLYVFRQFLCISSPPNLLPVDESFRFLSVSRLAAVLGLGPQSGWCCLIFNQSILLLIGVGWLAVSAVVCSFWPALCMLCTFAVVGRPNYTKGKLFCGSRMPCVLSREFESGRVYNG
jgi:hypothetical protein